MQTGCHGTRGQRSPWLRGLRVGIVPDCADMAVIYCRLRITALSVVTSKLARSLWVTDLTDVTFKQARSLWVTALTVLTVKQACSLWVTDLTDVTFKQAPSLSVIALTDVTIKQVRSLSVIALTNVTSKQARSLRITALTNVTAVSLLQWRGILVYFCRKETSRIIANKCLYNWREKIGGGGGCLKGQCQKKLVWKIT